MGRFHGNFGHPRSNAAKITQKKRFARKTPNFIYRLSSGPICANCVLTADPILLTGFCIYCDHWDDSFLQFPSCVRVVNTSANGIKHALYSGTHKVTRRTKNFSAKWSIRVIQVPTTRLRESGAGFTGAIIYPIFSNYQHSEKVSIITLVILLVFTTRVFFNGCRSQSGVTVLFSYYKNRTEVDDKKQLHHKNTITHLKEARHIAQHTLLIMTAMSSDLI